MKFNIDNTFQVELPSDPERQNSRRQVKNAAFSYVKPKKATAPLLIHASEEVGQLLGLSKEDLDSDEFLQLFVGNSIYEGTDPYAMCYAGHQFGNWAGQLGDGRAINLFEVVNDQKRWAVQLKGAGETPYSRNADGLAVLRSSVREHLCSEAMHALGVPTTRSLSLILSGDMVNRDMLYDGHPALEKGAIVCRVSPSFVRFGNFEIFAAQQDKENLVKLLDHVIHHFYKDITSEGTQKYLDFFSQLCDRTLDVVIHWQRVGFVHGVMNTDNMSALGLTIDYGPYGWLEPYDEDWTPNTTDRQHRRYRYGQQGKIALWNLYQLANALFTVIGEGEPLQEILENYEDKYEPAFNKMMLSKMGIFSMNEEDVKLVDDVREVLQLSETDMTIFFRNLSFVKWNDTFDQFNEIIEPAFYKLEEIKGEILIKWQLWFESYAFRLQKETLSYVERMEKMNSINPKYVLRNYMAQLAIDAADQADYSIIFELYELLKKPYAEQPDHQKWFAKRPEWARHKVGCSMLSCSS